MRFQIGTKDLKGWFLLKSIGNYGVIGIDIKQNLNVTIDLVNKGSLESYTFSLVVYIVTIVLSLFV